MQSLSFFAQAAPFVIYIAVLRRFPFNFLNGVDDVGSIRWLGDGVIRTRPGVCAYVAFRGMINFFVADEQKVEV
jgi:hypothetical protein